MSSSAIVLAGGRGVRFWPKSRRSWPKQFLSLTPDAKTLLVKTIQRLSPLIPRRNILLVSGKENARLIDKIMPDFPKNQIILEPMPRNTAAAVAVGLLSLLYRKGVSENEGVVILPADHHISDEVRFRAAIKKGLEGALKCEKIVLLGIPPTRPETGYGYVQIGGKLKNSPFREVSLFTEKPPMQKAKRWVSSGKYLWNSGMFMASLGTLIEEYRRFLPDLFFALEREFQKESSTETFALSSSVPRSSSPSTPGNLLHGDPSLRMSSPGLTGGSTSGQSCVGRASPDSLRALYSTLPSISIDVGVIEKTERLLVLPVEMGWSDLGSWASLADVNRSLPEGVVLAKRFAGIDVKDCTIYAEGEKVISAIGVENLVIVSTKDALLICQKERVQEVKKLTELIEKKGWKDVL